MTEQPKQLAIGDAVRWTETRFVGSSISMTVKDGTLLSIDGPVGTVRLKSGRKRVVSMAELHTRDVPTRLDQFMKARGN